MGNSRYAAPPTTRSGGRAKPGKTGGRARHITRWGANKDIALLCAITKECRRDKCRLSWDRIARWVGPNVTGAAIEQHIAKLYGKLKEWRGTQEPRRKKRKTDEDDLEFDHVDDDNIWSKGNEAFANIFYDKPEHCAGMIDYDDDGEEVVDEFGVKSRKRRMIVEDDEDNDEEEAGPFMTGNYGYTASQGVPGPGYGTYGDATGLPSGMNGQGTISHYAPDAPSRQPAPSPPMGRQASMVPHSPYGSPQSDFAHPGHRYGGNTGSFQHMTPPMAHGRQAPVAPMSGDVRGQMQIPPPFQNLTPAQLAQYAQYAASQAQYNQTGRPVRGGGYAMHPMQGQFSGMRQGVPQPMSRPQSRPRSSTSIQQTAANTSDGVKEDSSSLAEAALKSIEEDNPKTKTEGYEDGAEDDKTSDAQEEELYEQFSKSNAPFSGP